MKKLPFIFLFFMVLSCGISKKKSSNPLYEILKTQNNGGASIQFFEILSEPREIKMLLNDSDLKRKIKLNDITTCNYVILNLGEKTSEGYSISIKNVEETSDKIIITVEENEPIYSAEKLVEFVTPFVILKINSKKEIVFK